VVYSNLGQVDVLAGEGVVSLDGWVWLAGALPEVGAEAVGWVEDGFVDAGELGGDVLVVVGQDDSGEERLTWRRGLAGGSASETCI
jgi:hypothetical protein